MKPPVPLPILTPELSQAGFKAASDRVYRRIVASTHAREKSGKTHFATTWPKPIAILSTDTGTQEVVDKLVREGRFRKEDVVVSYFDIPEQPVQSSKDEYEKVWEAMRRASLAVLASPHIRTLVYDTHTEVWEMVRLARHGKLAQILPHQYGPLNAEMRALLKREYARPDLNILYIQKVKKEYKEGKKGDSNWTGEWERAGFGDVPFLVDINLSNYFNPESKTFGVRILDCPRQNPDCVGLELEGEECNYAHLAGSLWDELYTEFES